MAETYVEQLLNGNPTLAAELSSMLDYYNKRHWYQLTEILIAATFGKDGEPTAAFDNLDLKDALSKQFSGIYVCIYVYMHVCIFCYVFLYCLLYIHIHALYIYALVYALNTSIHKYVICT